MLLSSRSLLYGFNNNFPITPRASIISCALRASESNDLLHAAIEEAISRKPKGHDFVIDRRHKRPALARHMSVTGG